MKTLEISNRPRDVRPLLELASEENLVITTPGGRQFVLAEIDDFGEEVRLVRENAELMAFLTARSHGSGRLTEAQLRKRLGLPLAARPVKRRPRASTTR
ncbi:MAG TPA: hypothetical protein VNE39_11340 [Planctomycetota bacterium]|nr:hypothetical protein [Planctomycetota bacterium]